LIGRTRRHGDRWTGRGPISAEPASADIAVVAAGAGRVVNGHERAVRAGGDGNGLIPRAAFVGQNGAADRCHLEDASAVGGISELLDNAAGPGPVQTARAGLVGHDKCADAGHRHVRAAAPWIADVLRLDGDVAGLRDAVSVEQAHEALRPVVRGVAAKVGPSDREIAVAVGRDGGGVLDAGAHGRHFDRLGVERRVVGGEAAEKHVMPVAAGAGPGPNRHERPVEIGGDAFRRVDAGGVRVKEDRIVKRLAGRIKPAGKDR
jgi:hypothetical protein